jgi:hypothetical protein
MTQIARYTLISFIALIAVLTVAAFIHFQLRLEAVVGQAVVLELDKDTWLGCLAEPNLDGRIEKVELDGIIITDTSGSLTRANSAPTAANRKLLCPGFGLVLLDEKSKQYFVPFHSLAGIRKGTGWHWSNPFPT